MKYEYYVESHNNRNDGSFHARVLTAAEAEKLGYEDEYWLKKDGEEIYVEGFTSKRVAENYYKSLFE